jgi:hypothetical protein
MKKISRFTNIKVLFIFGMIFAMSLAEFKIIENINKDINYLNENIYDKKANYCDNNQKVYIEDFNKFSNDIDKENISIYSKEISKKQKITFNKLFLYQSKINCIKSKISNLDKDFIKNAFFNIKQLKIEAEKIKKLNDTLPATETEIIRDYTDLEKLISKIDYQSHQIDTPMEDIRAFKALNEQMILSVKLANNEKQAFISNLHYYFYILNYKHKFNKDDVWIVDYIFLKYLCILGLILNFILLLILILKKPILKLVELRSINN